MLSNPIRYRFAVLLLWAAMVLVANPVLHAFCHDHFHSVEHLDESIADVRWAEQDLCPYCDAVPQFVQPALVDASIAPAIIQQDIEPALTHYPDLRLRLSTRLRAPPNLT